MEPSKMAMAAFNLFGLFRHARVRRRPRKKHAVEKKHLVVEMLFHNESPVCIWGERREDAKCPGKLQPLGAFCHCGPFCMRGSISLSFVEKSPSMLRLKSKRVKY